MAEKFWLPEGHNWNLHIEHAQLEDAGQFTGGGNKWLWHTTESNWDSVDAMFGVLRDKRAAPHFVIGGRPGITHPVVIQMLPLNRAGRALANNPDGFDTNRADVIQVEICWRAGLAADLREWHYKAFANLVRLTNITVPDDREVPRVLARRFANTTRFTDEAFVRVEGHCGHLHAPDNTHWDPGSDFRGGLLMELLGEVPNGGYDL